MLRSVAFIRAILCIVSLPGGIYGTQELEFRESRITFPDCSSSQDCVEAVALIIRAQQAVSQRNYGDAERLFRQSSKVVERVFGPGDSALAFVLNAQGTLSLLQGATRSSVPPVQQAVSIAERRKDPNLWFYLSTLASAEYARHDVEKSQRLFRRSIEEREGTGTPDDEITASLLTNWAEVLSLLGNHRQAHDSLMRAMTIAKGLKEPVSKSLRPWILNNLAMNEVRRRRHEAAESYFREALGSADISNGGNTMTMLLSNYADLLFFLKRKEEARQYRRRADLSRSFAQEQQKATVHVSELAITSRGKR